MMPRFNHALHIVPDDTGLLAGRRHGTTVRVGERNLRLAGRFHTSFDGAERVGFLLVVGELLHRARHARLGHHHPSLGYDLVDSIELGHVPVDRSVDLA